ncbi:MAG: hypothetical protein ACRDVP_09360 [Acidimicrobiales bacterium]
MSEDSRDFSDTRPFATHQKARSDDLDRALAMAKDAADTVVGLGVLAFQRLQVLRVEAGRRLGTAKVAPPSPARAELRRTAARVDSALEGLLRVSGPVAERLPARARVLSSIATAGLKEARRQTSRLMGTPPGSAGRTD